MNLKCLTEGKHHALALFLLWETENPSLVISEDNSEVDV